jgi:DNA-binding NarL/FixJ family response regulator
MSERRARIATDIRAAAETWRDINLTPEDQTAYEQGKISLRQLATKTGYDHRQIAKWLRDKGKQIYTKGEQHQIRAFQLPPEDLQAYNSGEVGAEILAGKHGMSVPAILRALRIQAIPIREGFKPKTDRNQQIYQAFQRGETAEDLAREHGVSATNILRIVRTLAEKEGVPVRKKTRTKPSQIEYDLTPEQIDRFLRKETTAAQLAREVGCSTGHIYVLLNRHQVYLDPTEKKARNEQVWELYKQGQTIPKIAQQTNTTPVNVKHLIERMRSQKEPNRTRLLTTAQQIRDQIGDTYCTAGGPCKEAAEALHQQLQQQGIQATLVAGTVVPEIKTEQLTPEEAAKRRYIQPGDETSHYWVLLPNNYILDPTADQFDLDGSGQFVQPKVLYAPADEVPWYVPAAMVQQLLANATKNN